MEPTDALFDAINRGDLSVARDAISRGADLFGHNVLGMTPLDLAIDLGRNDITFLLMSNRANDDPNRRLPVSATAAQKASAKPAKPTPAQRRAAVAIAQPVSPQTPRLFSGDGGAPVPTAGFLGFDPTRR